MKESLCNLPGLPGEFREEFGDPPEDENEEGGRNRGDSFRELLLAIE